MAVRNPSWIVRQRDYGRVLPKSNNGRAVAISPDGRHIAVAEGNNQIRRMPTQRARRRVLVPTVQGLGSGRVNELQLNFRR